MTARNTALWILCIIIGAVCLIGGLSGCTEMEKKPTAVYDFDPKSVEIPVMTLFSWGF